uniref:Uncharacterized protein n=1 Tax=Urocitellus parryii TaxID=9999 RepID=A0A8D2KD25_UROPR
MAAAKPGDLASTPNSPGLLLGHFVASGLVTQEMLNVSKKAAPCFEKFSRLQQITNIQAEIYQKSLEIELLKLEKDAADVVHPFSLDIWIHVWRIMAKKIHTVSVEGSHRTGIQTHLLTASLLYSTSVY